MNKSPLLAAFLLAIATTSVGSEGEKPVVIITQDGEVDDRSSFMRLLLYTPDIDLRGIIATNSKWQRNGHGLDWIQDAYQRYGRVRENLLLHDPDYPSVERLQSVTVLGNEDPQHLSGGAPYVDSEGSELIVKELLKMDEELLHLNCWGGVNTVAHALWKFRENHPEAFAKNIGQVRVITIDFQDEAGDWLVKNMPEVRVIRCNAFHMTWNYHTLDNPLRHNPHQNFMSSKWLRENVKHGHGPLGSWYPQDNVSEGDTPAYLNFVDNGLKAYENYGLGGWGGRYHSIDGNYWADAPDDNNTNKALWRWIPDVQNDFAARVDWTVQSYEEANHPPVIETVTAPEQVKRGQRVELKAAGADPDGDNIYYYWWHYPDPTGMVQPIKITHETGSSASFVVPESASGAITIILELSDDGSPSLKRYSRLVFDIED